MEQSKKHNETIKYKYTCEICNIKARSDTEWNRHINSTKHKRGGLTPSTCTICDLKLSNPWNLRNHNILVHSSLEEREKSKYYCKICDTVFLSEQLYNDHNMRKKHLTTIECNKTLEEVKKIVEMRKNPINLEILESYKTNSLIN